MEICSLFFWFWTALMSCCFTISAFSYKGAAQNNPKFSALLAFGDSAVDTGNNRYLATVCQAGHPPYGKRFPGNISTGRFSDGKLVPDMLASILGIKDTIPPYLHPNLSDHELITGVSFASACAGLDERTNAQRQSGTIIPVSKQPEYLTDYISRLTTIVGGQEAQRIVNEALVIIHAGGNDFLDRSNPAHEEKKSGLNDYRDFLLNKLQTFLEAVVKSLGSASAWLPLDGGGGDTAAGLFTNHDYQKIPIFKEMCRKYRKSPFSRKCVESMNLEAESYNQKLAQLLPQIQASLPGSKFICQGTIASVLDMIQSPNKYGFVETDKGCCGTELFEVGPLCNQLSPVCRNSSQYLFWDSVHPSEATYLHFARQIFNTLSNLTSS